MILIYLQHNLNRLNIKLTQHWTFYESPDGTELCLERAKKIMLDGNLFKDTNKKVVNDIMKKERMKIY